MELLSKLRLGRSSLRVLLSLAPCDDEEEDGEGKEEDNMIGISSSSSSSVPVSVLRRRHELPYYRVD